MVRRGNAPWARARHLLPSRARAMLLTPSLPIAFYAKKKTKSQSLFARRKNTKSLWTRQHWEGLRKVRTGTRQIQPAGCSKTRLQGDPWISLHGEESKSRTVQRTRGQYLASLFKGTLVPASPFLDSLRALHDGLRALHDGLRALHYNVARRLWKRGTGKSSFWRNQKTAELYTRVEREQHWSIKNWIFYCAMCVTWYLDNFIKFLDLQFLS